MIKLEITENNSENHYLSLNFSEDLKFVSILGQSLLKQDLSSIAPLLSDETTMVLYDLQTIVGAKNIVDYWQDFFSNCKKDNAFVKYTVKWSKWFSQPMLEISSRCSKGIEDWYVFLKISYEEKGYCITRIEQIPKSIGDAFVAGPDLSWERIDLKKIKKRLTEKADPKLYHISCFDCGTPSEFLNWYREVDIPMGIHGYVGELSVCPYCNKIIEFIPQMRLRYEKPKFLDGEKPKTNEPPFLLI